jgi:hypothetical protein
LGCGSGNREVGNLVALSIQGHHGLDVRGPGGEVDAPSEGRAEICGGDLDRGPPGSQ